MKDLKFGTTTAGCFVVVPKGFITDNYLRAHTVNSTNVYFKHNLNLVSYLMFKCYV